MWTTVATLVAALLATSLLIHWVQTRERKRRLAEQRREQVRQRHAWHRRRRAARKNGASED